LNLKDEDILRHRKSRISKKKKERTGIPGIMRSHNPARYIIVSRLIHEVKAAVQARMSYHK